MEESLRTFEIDESFLSGYEEWLESLDLAPVVPVGECPICLKELLSPECPVCKEGD